ncbi:MAG: TolC family protein, partial [Chlamydiia bacterium]|nr:TolC family protein [Chlamydiia bacterium]
MRSPIQKALFCLALLGSSVLASVQVLHLEDAMDLAFCNNPSLQELKGRIAEAEARICQARAQYYPTVRADLSYQGGDAPSFYLFHTIDAGRLDSGTDFNEPGGLTNVGYGLSLEGELFNWGRTGHRLAAACAGRQAEEHRSCDFANQLLGMITGIYLDTLKAAAAYETAERSMALVGKQLDVAEKKLRKEVILRVDVLKLEVRLAEAQERSIRALSAQQQAMQVLATLLGLEDATEFTTTAETAFPSIEPDAVEWEVPLTHAVWAAEADVVRACEDVQAAKTYTWPRLGYFAKAYVDSPDHPFRNERSNWVAGCALSWELFTGGRVSGQKCEAQAALHQAEQRLCQARLQTREQLAIAQLRKREAEERLRVSEIGERSAQ